MWAEWTLIERQYRGSFVGSERSQRSHQKGMGEDLRGKREEGEKGKKERETKGSLRQVSVKYIKGREGGYEGGKKRILNWHTHMYMCIKRHKKYKIILIASKATDPSNIL